MVRFVTIVRVFLTKKIGEKNQKFNRKQFCFKARSQTRIRFKEGSPEECSLLSENFDDDDDEDETDVDQVIHCVTLIDFLPLIKRVTQFLKTPFP